ncbi:MAG: sulfur carrier protein ThiS [Myxococcota bacterium]|jgi:thiamine biosynthesis protein ThiS|nr:sulfur carrier protein ThiS [Myxococcota bacterium]
MAIHVRFDGEDLELADEATVGDLLRELGLSAPLLSVMVNGTVIRRSRYEVHSLDEGDAVTAVVQVGGG